MSNRTVPRLKDVAALAGVSVGAASRILRGDTDSFGSEAINRVVAAASQLGWRRNLLVAGIQTGQTKTVGVLIPPYDSFWINVLSGIHNQLAAADFLPITIWIGDLEGLPHFEADDETGFQQINRLLDRRVDALIMWPQIACAFRKYFTDVARRNVPAVVIDLLNDDPFGDRVLASTTGSTQQVADHLLGLGHRRMGCLTERDAPSHSWASARLKTFTDAIKMIPEASLKVAKFDARVDDGFEVAYQLLFGAERPTAVFGVSDYLAEYLYHAAAKLGLRIPDDLSIVGFGDLDFSAKLVPPLTTVHQYPKEIGKIAAELILNRLASSGQPAAFKSVEIAGEFLLRNSTAPPPK